MSKVVEDRASVVARRILFDEYNTSTYLAEYQNPVIEETEPEENKQKVKVREEYKPPSFIESLNHWVEKVPFDLMWKAYPKDIIRTIPTNMVQAYSKPPPKCSKLETETDTSSTKVIMPAGICLEDVVKEHREVVLRDMYQTTAQIMAREGAMSVTNDCLSPFETELSSTVKFTLPRTRPPKVPKEWLMESLSWDRKQLRSHVEPTKEFWLNFRK